mgnify:CR=1 FL=1
MEQTLSSIQSSLVEEISSSKNEPQWLKEYRKNSLSIYNELPAEVSPLYGNILMQNVWIQKWSHYL